jgi:hypothetical protein
LFRTSCRLRNATLVELKLTEQPTAERYLAGTLSEEEVVRFEEAMIERPELAADVDVRRRIKAGLQLLDERRELEPLLVPAKAKPQYLRYAAAAAVLVVAAGLWSTWRGQWATPDRTLISSSAIGASPIAATFMLARTRSADTPVFEVQRDGGPVRLRILVEDPEVATFDVTLGPVTEAPGAIPIHESSAAVAADGFAEIYLDPRGLSSGAYVLSLKSKAGAEQRFPFELRVSETTPSP